LFIVGDPEFRTEKVDAFEIGYRSQPHRLVSWSLSTYYNEYDDLRTIEPAPGGFLPLHWAISWKAAPTASTSGPVCRSRRGGGCRLAFRSVHKDLRFSAGASQLLGTEQAGNDPTSRATLKSTMDFGHWTVDAMLRYVGKLPSPESPSYTELGARIAWRPLISSNCP
jgi:iron complex outermembrane receptor protein